MIPTDKQQILTAEAARQPYPLLFATISGAHLYGFASPDSDYDLRGVHILPAREMLGLDAGCETIEVAKHEHGIEFDLVTHDARKFFLLMLKRNGYVLEQLYSPLVIHTTSEHEELKHIARDCITRHHVYHYLGFSRTQWDLFLKEEPRRIKPLLYVFRVLLTGIHLMRTGEIEANILRLNEECRLGYIDELVERKMNTTEQSTLETSDVEFYAKEVERMTAMLEEAGRTTTLPDAATAREALNDVLIRLRGIS